MEPATNQNKITVWFYRTTPTSRRRRGTYNHSKKLLYEILYRGITTHNLIDMYLLEKTLTRSTVIDSYAMFRYIMILISTEDTRKINKNFIMYLETSLARYDLSKPDMFVEILTYFIKNNRIEDARELFTARHKYMSYQFHRYVPHNDVNIACYSLLLNYIDWHKRLVTQEQKAFDVSTQGWLVNAMASLKQVQHNYEFFIMCIVNVLLHYNFHKKAYLLLSEFQRANPDNITSQLLLYNLIKKLTVGKSIGRQRVIANQGDEMEVDDSEEALKEHRSAESDAINNFSVEENSEPFGIENYPVLSDNEEILRNLIRLDPRRDEVLELSETYHDKIGTIQIIMDSLMEVPTMGDASRWRSLQTLIDELVSSGDSDLVKRMATLWQTRYQPYWRMEDFFRLTRGPSDSTMGTSRTDIIERVMITLKSNFDCDIPIEVENEEAEDESLYALF